MSQNEKDRAVDQPQADTAQPQPKPACAGCKNCQCCKKTELVFALPNGDGRWLFPGLTDGSYPLPH